MSEELDFEMPMALCSNYQASMKEIEELKEKIAELEEQNAELKKQNDELTKIIEEIPPPPKIKVTQFNRHVYKCCDYGHKKHEECPQKGRFGVNLLVYLTRLKFSIRGVLRRIKDFASHLNSFDITPKGIQDAILRVGEACKSAYIKNGLGDWTGIHASFIQEWSQQTISASRLSGSMCSCERL